MRRPEPRHLLWRVAGFLSGVHMPYALFEDDEQLSRAFATEAEVWRHAVKAGLVETTGDIDRLENHLSIKPCPDETPVTVRP